MLLHPELEAGAVLGGTAGAVLGEEHDAAAGDGSGQESGSRTRPLAGRRGRHVAGGLRSCERAAVGSERRAKTGGRDGEEAISLHVCLAPRSHRDDWDSANRGHMGPSPAGRVKLRGSAASGWIWVTSWRVLGFAVVMKECERPGAKNPLI